MMHVTATCCGKARHAGLRVEELVFHVFQLYFLGHLMLSLGSNASNARLSFFKVFSLCLVQATVTNLSTENYTVTQTFKALLSI